MSGSADSINASYFPATWADPIHRCCGAEISLSGRRAGARKHLVIVCTKIEGYVELDGRRYTINSGEYQLNGYSAHADKDSLLRFVKGMQGKLSEIRLIRGDTQAKAALQHALLEVASDANVLIP